MEVALGSRANVREVLEFLEIIESTRFQDLPENWPNRTTRSVDYQPGLTERGRDFIY